MNLMTLGKDTTLTKIFVGGLPYHTTDESLRQFFSNFGDIDEAVVITDRQTSKSRGYGFVTMSDREAAARACKDPNPVIDGRKANVNLAYLGAKPRSNVAAVAAAAQLPLALKAATYPGILGQPTGAVPQYIYSPLAASSTANSLNTAYSGLVPLQTPGLLDSSLYTQQLAVAQGLGLDTNAALGTVASTNTAAAAANLLTPQYYLPTTQLTGNTAAAYTLQPTQLNDRV